MGYHMRLFLAGRFTGRPAVVLSKTAAVVIVFIFLSGCGDTFRPVSNPIAQPGGDPSGTVEHAIVISANGASAGTTMHIDVSGDTVVAVENVGINPVHAIIVGGEVFVANQGTLTVTGDTLSVYPVNAGPNGSVATLTMLPPNGSSATNSKPAFLASTDNTNVYVAQSGSDSIGVVPLATLTAGASVCKPAQPTPCQITDTSIVTPVAIAQLPNGGKVYVANQGKSMVTVIDPTQAPPAVKTAIPVLSASSAIVASADGNCVYVANPTSNNVAVINTGNDTVMGNITVGGGPSFLRFDPKLQRVYVANTTGGSISIINHAADCSATTATTVPVGTAPTSIAALSDGTRAYIANSGNNTVSVLLTSSNTIKTFPAPHNPVAIPVGTNPVAIGSSADGTRVVVANKGSANISIIRTSDDTVIATQPAIPAGASPQFVLMNP